MYLTFDTLGFKEPVCYQTYNDSNLQTSAVTYHSLDETQMQIILFITVSYGKLSLLKYKSTLQFATAKRTGVNFFLQCDKRMFCL